jgi:hypothetical protein
MQLNPVNMKSLAIGILFGLALTLPAQAFLRPRLPHRTRPPYGEPAIIIVNDDSVRQAIAHSR